MLEGIIGESGVGSAGSGAGWVGVGDIWITRVGVGASGVGDSSATVIAVGDSSSSIEAAVLEQATRITGTRLNKIIRVTFETLMPEACLPVLEVRRGFYLPGRQPGPLTGTTRLTWA